MNKWVAVVCIFQQYLAHMMMMPGDNKILYVKEPRFRLKRFPPPAGLEFGWLVGCFGLNGPLRQYFSLYRAVSQREGERKEK